MEKMSGLQSVQNRSSIFNSVLNQKEDDESFGFNLQ
jgi:hypothetical protein